MVLQAKSNAEGRYWYPYDTVYNVTTYRPGDGTEQHFEDPFGVPRGATLKSYHVKSDHHHPTNYYREVVEVVSDEPYTFEDRVLRDGGARTETNSFTRHISVLIQNPAFWDYPPGYYGVMDNRRDKLITKLLNKLKQGREFNAGVALAESARTVDLLAQTSLHLLKSVRDFKNANFRGVLDNLRLTRKDLRSMLHDKSLANKYLEVQYGWLPLMSDIKDIHDDLTSKLERKQTFRVGGKEENVKFSYSHSPYDNEDWTGNLYGCIEASVFIPPLYEANASGLLNPLSIAWELVPFSFVVDWFSPVGNTLEALSATAGLQFESGYISTTNDGSRARTTGEVDFDIDSYWFRRVTGRGSHVTKYYTFRRDTMSGFPMPRLYAKDNPFSTQHVANALALLRGLL